MTEQAPTAVNAINISDVLRGIGRRWKMIALVTMLFAALGFVVIFLSRPLYTAEAQLLLKYQDSPYTQVGSNGGQARQVSDRELKSQVAVLKSRDLALKVIKRLNLAGTAEFDALKRGAGLGARLKIMLGFAPDPRRQSVEQRALTTWYKRLKVYNIPQSKIIVIEYSSHNPQVAAAVVNTLAAVYKESQARKTGEARAWLKEQIARLTREVEAIEKQASQYRAQKGLFKGAQSSLSNQELSELSSQIIKAASERSHAQARARAIREMLRRTGSLDASAEVLKSRLIQRLREQQSQLQRRLAELSTTYLDNHPKVRAVRRELAGLKRQIKSEALKIAASLEQQAKIAASREAALRAAFARLKAKVSTASFDEVKLRDLELQAKSKRSLLDSYLVRYNDAVARDRKIAQLNTVHVISPADVPVMPSFPKPGPIMILAILAGLVLGLGAAFAAEVMGAVSRMGQGGAQPLHPAAPAVAPSAPAAQPVAAAQQPAPPAAAVATAAPAVSPAAAVAVDTAALQPGNAPSEPVRTEAAPAAATGDAVRAGDSMDVPAGGAEKAEAVKSLPLLPALPQKMVAKSFALTALSAPHTPYAKAAGAVAEWVDEMHGRAGVSRYAFAALGGAAADAATAALSVGRILASRGARVIVADVDMGEKSLDLAAGTQAGKGLSDLLNGQAGFVDIIKRDIVSPLHIIHAGSMPDKAAGKLGTPVMEAVLAAMGETYDVILLNEGETRFPADRESSVLPLCGAVLAVARQKDGGLAESLCGALRGKGVKLAECLLVAGSAEQHGGPRPANRDGQDAAATQEPEQAAGSASLRAASLF